MTEYVVTPPAQVSLPVAGTHARFPVARIFCVGRNYAAHAIEMGHDPDKEPPFFFMKSADCIGQPGTDFVYPPASEDVHFELEQVLALGQGGADVGVEAALSHIYAYGVGLDMTRRDLQGAAKKLGRPWEVGKSFAGSAPMSALVPVAQIGHPSKGAVTLDVGGTRRQSGDLDQMIWKPAEIIAHLSRLFVLMPGDLIMTGTPAGVGPIARGDVMEGHVAGIAQLRVRVV
ncbi:fumarylacetoacetate hydrolase family protein [Roseobacteraceae bacterium S113]